jgi:opacity protein-like surface antigen
MKIIIRNCLRANIFLIPGLCCGLATSSVHAGDPGWFLTGDVGPSFAHDLSVSSSGPFGLGPATTTRLSFRPGVRLDLDGGYRFDDSWALNLEVGYIYNSVKFATSTTSTSTGLHQVPILVDGIYTLPFKWPVKPYVGAGLGLVASTLNGSEDVSGAGQLLAGLKFEINPQMDISLEYKLLGTTKHNWNSILSTDEGSRTINNSVLASFTIKF